MTVSGAYGRDYKSAGAIKRDRDANLDFRLRSVGGYIEGDGYVNKEQVPSAKIWGRYARDTKIVKLQ